MNEYDIAKAFEAIENELIESMIRNLERHKAEEAREGIRWSQWQAEQLKALERYKIKNRKKFGDAFARLNRDMTEFIRQAKIKGGMEQEKAILQAIKKGFKTSGKNMSGVAGGTAEFFKLNEKKLEALLKSTTSDMKKAEIAILRMADDQYRKVIFNAQVYANTGAGTYEKAVDMATKDFLAAGLTCIEYKNGARHTLADYADMALRTASKRAYLQGEGEKRQEWGISLVIVNKRGNPCPKCLPYVGKIMIDDVWSGGKKSDGPYPLISTAISNGLYHPRCKDSHTTYFEGITTAESKWTKEELNEIESKNKKEAESQYAKRQVKKYERLEKYSLAPENRQKYGIKKGQWENEVRKPEFLSMVNWEAMDIDTITRIQNELSLIPEPHQRILIDAGVEIEIIENGNSFYDPRDKKIRIIKGVEDYEVIHEIAHAIEDVTGIWEDPEFKEILTKLSKRYRAEDIITDNTTYVKPIRRIEDHRFISEYQGRVYMEAGEITKDGYVNPDALWDYFSEGYSCFLKAPELLKTKDKELYSYIERRMKK